MQNKKILLCCSGTFLCLDNSYSPHIQYFKILPDPPKSTQINTDDRSIRIIQEQPISSNINKNQPILTRIDQDQPRLTKINQDKPRSTKIKKIDQDHYKPTKIKQDKPR